MKNLFSNAANTVKELWEELNDPQEPITNYDKHQLYKEYRSFSGFLPYAEWLEEHNMMLLEDHVSVAALWEIDPVRSEGMDLEYMNNIETQLVAATAGVLEKASKEGQYVLSCYTQDEFSLNEEFEMIEASIHPEWKNTALAKEYLKSLSNMMKGMESESGLFSETMRKGGDDSDSAMRPYRGGKRKHRIMLYRRVKVQNRKGKDEIRNNEIKALKNLIGVVEAAIGQFASIKRIDREGFYNFMVRFLNHSPSSTRGDINRLLKENPCPPEELASINSEYALSMLHSKINTDSEKGVIEFDDCPARFLQIERLNAIPPSGALTAEKIDPRTNEVNTSFDSFPAGSIFVQHIIFEDQDEKKESLKQLEKNSRTVEDEAILTNEQCKKSIELMAKGRSLYKVEMGVYLFAKNIKELDKITEQTKVALTNKLKLKAISPENNLFPIESFIRNIPLVYDPFLDNRRKRGRTSWYHHAVRFIPIMGRTRGFIGRTKSVCSQNFNRRGELILFDPLDYDGNAHCTILGPSGLGKSATLNKSIIELLIFKNARIFIAEAGKSFDPLMDFLEAESMDVQRVNIGAGADSKPVAPFGSAKKARDDFLSDAGEDTKSRELYLDNLLANLEEFGVFSEGEEEVLENLSEDETSVFIENKRAETKQRILASFYASQANEAEEDKKDYMGECIMIAKIMVTGGDPKEEDKFCLQDVTFLTHAIVEAANIADAQNEVTVRPTHLETALRNISVGYKEDNHEAYKRLQEMADNLSLYTKSIRGKILNKKAEPFRNCDCLHVELGVAQRSGNEDLLALSYLSLMNMINDVAESKAEKGDDRPIYVITDEAHLILKDRRIAPIAVKIVRMWRKYGAWFLPATQDIANSFVGEASAILQICEYFIALKPPPEDLEALVELARLSEEDKKLVENARAEKYKYTEAVIINKTRSESALVRIVQPSFTLAIAGTEDKEKNEREALMKKYKIRVAGATLIQAQNLDLRRGIINKQEHELAIDKIVNEPKYKLAS